MIRSDRPDERWVVVRKRILLQTEQYLALCLRRPELAVVIPVIPAGRGRFPPSLAEHFWAQVLDV